MSANPAAPRDWFGQPRGLTILFLTEMWEKFSYFGMRALLVYYLTKQLLMGQQQASLVYGLYTAFTYFTPIIGGYISDRWLGRRRAVIVGGLIMALGHFLMAFEPLVYPALTCIAIGNGLFLPSLPSQVGALYDARDARRGRAYNVYYVGVNLGAFLAPLICGTLGETLGWHYGFAAAGLGMLAGLVIYIAGSAYLPADPVRSPPASASTGALNASPAAPRLRLRDQRQLLLLLGSIGICVVIFRGAYEQVGNTLALWADSGVDRRIGGWTIPMTWFQALNPLLVFSLTPVILAHWARQAARGREPLPAIKMSLGAAGVATGFLMLAAVAALSGGDRASWIWLVAFFVLFTAGELFILPVGLGLFARLAPAGLGATIVAWWFFASFVGNLIAGALGALWSTLGPASFFAITGGIAGLAALGLALLGPWLGQAVAAQDARSGEH